MLGTEAPPVRTQRASIHGDRFPVATQPVEQRRVRDLVLEAFGIATREQIDGAPREPLAVGEVAARMRQAAQVVPQHRHLAGPQTVDGPDEGLAAS